MRFAVLLFSFLLFLSFSAAAQGLAPTTPAKEYIYFDGKIAVIENATSTVATASKAKANLMATKALLFFCAAKTNSSASLGFSEPLSLFSYCKGSVASTRSGRLFFTRMAKSPKEVAELHPPRTGDTPLLHSKE